MDNLYQNDVRKATIEKLFTQDYMVEFVDNEMSSTQFETFHKLEQAEDAAKRWLEFNYDPI